MSTLDWVQDFDLSLKAGITADQRFYFRIFLIPHAGPKTAADAAMTFVPADQFSPEQNAVISIPDWGASGDAVRQRAELTP